MYGAVKTDAFLSSRLEQFRLNKANGDQYITSSFWHILIEMRANISEQISHPNKH
jgi:hypothetical protein